ncbi:hypothetical protein NPIL_684351 [Nephila pilipes]|uniref:Uncharacterized protein n=1 Tax=Nephila pilipes TaxID=299642 RepID=A0A8X6NTF9_NEPPI|nr:hypothetical protein NPIL_684351 [Nephila pilipes]
MGSEFHFLHPHNLSQTSRIEKKYFAIEGPSASFQLNFIFPADCICSILQFGIAFSFVSAASAGKTLFCKAQGEREKEQGLISSLDHVAALRPFAGHVQISPISSIPKGTFT